MADQYTFTNPVTQYTNENFSDRQQGWPGLDTKMTPKADHGEDTYRGSGRLEGRKALITGGDSGIGRAVAIAYAREGVDVAINYHPEEQKDAESVRKLIEDAGRKAVLLPCDLMDEDATRRMVNDAVEKLGGLDILVNNGSRQQYCDDIADLTSADFDATFKTNVYAMFWITQEALPHMPAGSTIINTSSIQAYKPSDHLLDYATTKAAINTFSKGLAQQLAPKGIRVNVVAPGPFWTPLQVSGGQPKEALPEFGQSTPMGRSGQPAEVAGAYVYLASAESGYVTGETLNINGGMLSP